MAATRATPRAIQRLTNPRSFPHAGKAGPSRLAALPVPRGRISARALSSSARRHDGLAQGKMVVKGQDARNSFKDPLTRYEHLVKVGTLKADSHQRTIIQQLQSLHDSLVGYDPGLVPPQTEELTPSFFGKFFSRAPSIPTPTVPLESVPKGLYLYGSVGTGKTMLMDLFHSTLPSQFAGKTGKYGSTRIHFHAFMLDVLSRQHKVKARYEAMGLGSKDAMPEVARSLAAEGRVLCFDEFQVTDIVTAMILRQLLERLMGFGVVCIMTSNRHPDELYMNGIQRQSFIPAIDLIKSRFKVVDLDSGTDYRKVPRAISNVYLHPLSPDTSSEMTKLFRSLASADARDPNITPNRKLSLWGRTLLVPESSGSVARFKFADLCNKPLSAADYLEVTGKFPTIFVEDVPRMGLGERDQARRFITFIDACYENRTKLFASSEVPIQQVFSDKDGRQEGYDAHMRSIMDDLGLSAQEVGASSLFSGDEELFAFARCVSRLTQMGTKEWAEATA